MLNPSTTIVLKAANILLDRKVLSDIALTDEKTFLEIVGKVKAALAAKNSLVTPC